VSRMMQSIHLPLSVPVLSLALAFSAGTVAAQDGLVVEQKTTYSIARVGNGDLTQTMMLLGDDRMKTKTEGRVRFLVFSRDASGTELIRLDQRQVYDIDDRRRRYQVRSLDQTRSEMESQQQQAQAAVADVQQDDGDVRYTIETDGFQRTGQRQTINGFSTEQGLLKLTIVAEDTRTGEKSPVFYLTADMWMDQSQRAVGRATQAFHMNYMQQLGIDPRTAGNPYGRWLSDLYKQMADIEGYPIRTTITFEAAVEPGEAAQAPAAERRDQQPTASDVAANPVGAVAGRLARRAAQARQQQAQEQRSGRPVLFTTTTEVISISTRAPSSAEFEVPEGYRRN
jgi:hypothetical protein